MARAERRREHRSALASAVCSQHGNNFAITEAPSLSIVKRSHSYPFGGCPDKVSPRHVDRNEPAGFTGDVTWQGSVKVVFHEVSSKVRTLSGCLA